ncbi:MAG: YkgJ family cysteine cluster protein [bacterium]
MNCRIGCAACCVAVSISSPIPGLPQGKPAGLRCVQLTENGRCKLFGHADRPEVCVRLKPSTEMCGQTDPQAYGYLAWLEDATQPPRVGLAPSFG